MNDILEQISQLSVDTRNYAMQQARERLAGRKPERADYDVRESKYPPLLTNAINAGGVLLLIFVFIPSAIRVYDAGFNIGAGRITDEVSRAWFGLCAVLSAEIGQVLFSLMAAKALEPLYAKIFNYGAITCTLIAISGNAWVADWHVLTSPFAFLETFAPPVLVLITAYVFKQQILDAVADRSEAQRQFDIADKAWNEAYDTAHLDSLWQRTAANSLRDAIMLKEKRRPKFMAGLTRDQWQLLVDREWFAENWYVATVAESQQLQQVARATPKLDATIAWLKNEANFSKVASLSNVAIGAELGVSHTLVQQAKAKIARGES